jgi:hypothetical protein
VCCAVLAMCAGRCTAASAPLPAAARRCHQLLLRHAGGTTFCEWKGEATYWDVTTPGGQTAKRRWAHAKGGTELGGTGMQGVRRLPRAQAPARSASLIWCVTFIW